MSTFLHGIEHIDLPADFSVVNDVVTAVIALVGTSDAGAMNELVLCAGARDDAQFGTKGTIPEALRAIRLQDSKRGGALVFVVRVKADDDEVKAADIVGTVSETDQRTGLKLFDTAFAKYGFKPMIYIAPRFSAIVAVVAELVSITNKTGAIAYIDTPDGYTLAEALACKGVDGAFKNLNEGQKLFYPHFLVDNPDYQEGAVGTAKYINVPMSAYAAGLRAKVDIDEGWHVSSSNHAYTGVSSTDVPLTFAMGDRSSDVNRLNAQGITTAVNLYGGGWVEWGNYTAGYPANENPDAFECVRRTSTIIKMIIEKACLPFIDKPFIQAYIDAIRNTVNQALNGLQSQNKLLYGLCSFRPENNPVNDLARGIVTFDVDYTPAVPMQTIKFTYKIDLSQLNTVE